jgi:hypothetical protein
MRSLRKMNEKLDLSYFGNCCYYEFGVHLHITTITIAVVIVVTTSSSASWQTFSIHSYFYFQFDFLLNFKEVTALS